MIDTRFPPQPSRIKQSLYPLRSELAHYSALVGAFASGAVAILENRVAQHFNVGSDAVFLDSSARNVLGAFVRHLETRNGRVIHVALPAFYCPHTCLALVQAGARIAFYDIDDDLCPNPATVAKVLQLGCQVLIWPDLFAVHSPDPSVWTLSRARGTIVVRDRAHTFPIRDWHCAEDEIPEATLVSFGPSKPTAGTGGGGLILHNDGLRRSFAEFWSAMSIMPRDGMCGELRKNATVALQNRMRTRLPAVAEALHLVPPYASDQRELLASMLSEHKVADGESRKSISPLCSIVVSDRWRRLDKVWTEHKIRQQVTLSGVEMAFGRDATRHLRNAQSVATLAIRVPAQMRHRIATQLAARGIQTTWYYYPLNLLPRFSGFAHTGLDRSENIAAEILILPCHWGTTEANMDRVAPIDEDALLCALKN